jgi:hypothetical protein
MQWLSRDGLLRPLGATKPNLPQLVSELVDLIFAVLGHSEAEIIFHTDELGDYRGYSSEHNSTRRFLGMALQEIWHLPCQVGLSHSVTKPNSAWGQRPSNSEPRSQEKEWSKLWKIKVPPRSGCSLWRLARLSIPTSHVRHHRNMAMDGGCSLCSVDDLWRHALLECNLLARCVWA